MDILDGLWHLLNFFAPALSLGVMAPLMAKVLWRGELRSVAWSHLAQWTGLVCAVILVVGLVLFGRDGKMATYGAMCLGSALSIWWLGLRSSKR